VVDDHFHAITSITGFFRAVYFCDQCLKHYDHRVAQVWDLVYSM
jgi:hypothetical protein